MRRQPIEDKDIPEEMMVAEFAEVVGVSQRTVWNWVYKSMLFPKKDLRGRRWYSKLDAVVMRAIVNARHEE